MIRSVAELTNFNFEEIFQMQALEYFMYLRYVNEKRRREYLQAKKEEARIRAMRRK